MRQLRSTFLVAALILTETVPTHAQVESGPPSSTYTPLLSRCETTDPSPVALAVVIPPDLRGTERRLRTLLQTDPTDLDVQLELATLFEIKSDFPAALIGYQEALKLDRSCEDCLMAFVSLLSHCKQQSDAVRVTEKFLERTPTSVMATNQLALLHLQTENYPEVLDLAHKIRQLDRSSATSYQLQALAHLGLEELDEAEFYFKTALENDESLSEAHLRLGMMYTRRPETVDSAVRHLRKAIELGLAHPEVYKDLGHMLVNQSQYRDALVELHKALDMTSGYAEPYALLSQAYRGLGLEEYAEAAAKRFQVLDAWGNQAAPGSTPAETYYRMGMTFLQQNQPRQARAALLRSIEAEPNLDPAYFMLAQISSLASRPNEAIEWIRKAISINPVMPRYHLLLGEHLPTTEATAAIDAVKVAIKLNPSEGEFFNALGNVLFADGQNESAVKSYRHAIHLDQENPIFHLNLSTVLRNLGDEDGSKRERNLYLRLSAR